MIYYTIVPPLSLSAYVRFFWVLESNEPYCHRSMADGCAEMVFHYKGLFDEITVPTRAEKSFASGLHGPSRKFRRFTINEGFGIFGVYLYPFAIPKLFSMPASELADQVPDLQTVLGKEGSELEESMMLATDNSHRVRIIIAFLAKKLLVNNHVQLRFCSAINDIINTGGSIPVSDLARKYFLSLRQLERNFKAFSGFSPKLYSRIIRFQRATQQYGNPKKSLTEVAYDCGYYDQSHFIHDFKQFSGYQPKQYFSEKAEGLFPTDTGKKDSPN